MQVIVQLEGEKPAVQFFSSFSLDIGLLPLVPKDLDDTPLWIFLISTMTLMKPPTEENPVWRLRGWLHSNLSPLCFREVAYVLDKCTGT